jgi:hypothetical protein
MMIAEVSGLSEANLRTENGPRSNVIATSFPFEGGILKGSVDSHAPIAAKTQKASASFLDISVGRIILCR